MNTRRNLNKFVTCQSQFRVSGFLKKVQCPYRQCWWAPLVMPTTFIVILSRCSIQFSSYWNWTINRFHQAAIWLLWRLAWTSIP